MTIKAIQELLDAEPFRPFTLRIADGHAVPVENPHMVAFLGTGRTLFVAHSKTDRFELIDLLMVVSAVVGDGRAGGRRRRAA